jgi:hypothetical protein
MNAWIRRKLDISPCTRLHEALWGELTPAQRRDPAFTTLGWLRWKLGGAGRTIGEELQCFRLYIVFIDSWMEVRACARHVCAHQSFDEMCEFCHYRRCVKEKIGMSWNSRGGLFSIVGRLWFDFRNRKRPER